MFTSDTSQDVQRKDDLSLDFRLIVALSRSDDDIDKNVRGGEQPEGMFQNSGLRSLRIFLRVARKW
jgi:hypothetical protein